MPFNRNLDNLDVQSINFVAQTSARVIQWEINGWIAKVLTFPLLILFGLVFGFYYGFIIVLTGAAIVVVFSCFMIALNFFRAIC